MRRREGSPTGDELAALSLHVSDDYPAMTPQESSSVPTTNFSPFSPQQPHPDLPSSASVLSEQRGAYFTSPEPLGPARNTLALPSGISSRNPSFLDLRPPLEAYPGSNDMSGSPHSPALMSSAWGSHVGSSVPSPITRMSTTSFARSRLPFLEPGATQSPTAPLHGVSPWSTTRTQSSAPPSSNSGIWGSQASSITRPQTLRAVSSSQQLGAVTEGVQSGGRAFSLSHTGQPDWSEVEAAWSAKPNAVLSNPSRPRHSSASYPNRQSYHHATADVHPGGSNPSLGGRGGSNGHVGGAYGPRRERSSSARGGRGSSVGSLGKGKSRASGPSERNSVSPERKPYHPKAPSGGSNWVMWVGNVPHDATLEEATAFFNEMHSSKLSRPSPPFVVKYPPGQGPPVAPPPPASPPIETGIVSIFLILQSHCAFVNYDSDSHLQRALAYFNGRPLRIGGVKLVCRVRRKAEEIKSGVGGQRGLGLHKKWVEQHVMNTNLQLSGGSSSRASRSAHYQDALERYASHLSHPPPSAAPKDNAATSPSTSTTSTLLATYFPVRYFVLKAMTKVSNSFLTSLRSAD